MREYECRADGRYWHVGHVAPVIKQGRMTASDIYGGDRV
jgi:hypothetical protein